MIVKIWKLSLKTKPRTNDRVLGKTAAEQYNTVFADSEASIMTQLTLSRI